jgi:hypothetical protein
MQIGIVAKKVGLSVDAIRFYERNALLPRPARTPEAFANMAIVISKRWPSSGACKVWDSNLAKFADF